MDLNYGAKCQQCIYLAVPEHCQLAVVLNREAASRGEAAIEVSHDSPISGPHVNLWQVQRPTMVGANYMGGKRSSFPAGHCQYRPSHKMNVSETLHE